MRDFRKLNESFRSFIKRDDSHDSEKRGDDPNTMGTSLNSGYMEEERMLWEVTDDEMKQIKKFLGPENADKLSFSNLFGENNLRIAIPFPTEASNESPIVQLYHFFGNIGWQVDLSNGTVKREEASTRPDTGEEIRRTKSVRIGKMLKKLNSLLDKYHAMSLNVVKEETRGLEQYFEEHGVSGEEIFKVLREKELINGLSRPTMNSFGEFYEANLMSDQIEDIIDSCDSFSDFYRFQESFLNNSKSEFKNAGFALSMDMATAFSNLNQDILNVFLTIKTSNFDKDNRQAAKARLEIKREVREGLRSQIESVKSKRAEFSGKFKKDFYLLPWQFDPSQVATLLQFWNEKSEFYVNNPDALTENKYSIVISRSPIDVLRMSDFKNIESCHSPKSRGQGSYWQCAVAEARGQGLVAYVVENKDLDRVDLNDDEIFEDNKRGVDGIVPLARLRLRKYGFKGLSSDGSVRFAAIPEQRVYGMRFPELYKTVLKWAKENQIDQQLNGNIVSSTVDDQSGEGVVRYGGSYQDTPDAELINQFFGEHVLSLYAAVDTSDTETESNRDIVAKITGQVLPVINRINDALDSKFEEFSEETGTIWSQLRLEYEIRPELEERPLLYYLKGVMEFDDERLMLSDKKLYLSSTHRTQLENKIHSAIVEQMKKAGGDDHPINVFQVELNRDRVILYRQGARVGSQLYTYDAEGLNNYIDLVIPDFAKSDFVNIVERILTAAAVIYPKQKPANMDMGEFRDLVQKIKGPKPDEMSWGEYFSDLPDLGIKKDEPKSGSVDWRDYVKQADALQQRMNQQDRPAELEKDEKDDEEQIDEVSSLVDSLMNLSKKDKLLKELTDDEYARISHIVHGIKPQHLSFNDIFGDKRRLVMPFVPGPTGEFADMLEMLDQIDAKLNVEDGTIEKKITSVRKDTGEEVTSVRKMKVNKFFNKALSMQDKMAKLRKELKDVKMEDPSDPSEKERYHSEIGRLSRQYEEFSRKVSKEVGKLGLFEYWKPNIKQWMKFWQEKGEYYRQNPKAIEGETGKYSLVVTRAPIDVLRMSDFDDITSCHSPSSRGSGGYYACAVQEARGHGPIAYVVENDSIKKMGLDLEGNDEGWQKEEVFVDTNRGMNGIWPLSRVRIRKYVHNDSDMAIAVPETSTYGKRFPNLVSSVQELFRQKQQRKMQTLEEFTDLDDYTRYGGSYADSADEDLFDSFFESQEFYGSAETEHSEEGEEGDHDTFQEYTDEAERIQEEANRELEHSSVFYDVEEGDGEPYVYYSANGSIEIPYEADLSDWATWEIESKIKEILLGVVVANINDVTLEEEHNGLSIRIDFSNYEYTPDPEGFHDFYFHDIRGGFEGNYEKAKKEIKEFLAELDIIQLNKKDDYFAKVANVYKQEYNENVFKHFVVDTYDDEDEELEFSTKEGSEIPIDASIFITDKNTYKKSDEFAKGVEMGNYDAMHDLDNALEASGLQKDIWNVLLKVFNERTKQPLLPNIPPNSSDFDLHVEFPMEYFKLVRQKGPYKAPNNRGWLAEIKMVASFTGVIEDEDFILAMQLIEFLDENYDKVARVVQEKIPAFVGSVDNTMNALAGLFEVSKLANSIINEVEPFQKDTIKKHPKRKKMTIGLGGNKSTGGGPFKKKPSMKKNKSAPPGAGGV